jgi:hypothetical protein
MSRAWGERLAALMCISIALYMGWLALDFPAGGDTFPLFVVTSVVVIGSLMIATTVLTPERFAGRISLDLSFERLKPLLVAVLTVLYVLAIFRVGYYASTLVFFLAATLFIGVRDLRLILVTTGVLLLAIYAFFGLFLHAQLPRGLLL